MKHFVCLVLLICFVCCGDAFSKTPIPKHAFDISYIHINTPAGPHVGDTIFLTVKFVPTYTGVAKFRLNFPQNVVPLKQQIGEITRDSLFNIDSGIVAVDSIPLLVKDSGSSLLTFNIIADSSAIAMHHFLPETGDYLQISNSFGSFHVRYSDDVNLDSARTITLQNRSVSNATMFINGRVFFTTPDQKGDPQEIGVPKVMVYVAFSYNGQIVEPFSTAFSFSAKTDINGYFTISGNGPSTWLPYQTVVLYVGQYNDAASLYTLDHVTWSSGIKTFPGPDYKLWPLGEQNEGLQLPISSTDHIYFTGQRIEVNKADGAILRNMQLSQDFNQARGMTVPGGIPIYNGAPGSGYAGLYELTYNLFGANTSDIVIDKHNTELATCAHEWGHWFNANTWYSNFSKFDNASEDFKEGWAEFHQFAVRNWVASSISQGDIDFGSWDDDNQEEAPFSPYIRFNGIRYRGSTSAPSAAAFSCFLWSLYDKYSETGFKTPKYQGVDNDDVGIPFDVYNTVEIGGPLDMSGYISRILSGKSSSLQNSIAKISSLMFDNTLPMLPAQIKNLSGYINEMPTTGGAEHILYLNWLNQQYPSEATYKNLPSGIRIYESDGSGGWNSIGTVSGTSTSFSRANTTGSPIFKVTSYNDAGESYNPQIITCDYVYKKAEEYSITPSKGISLTSINPNPFVGKFEVNFIIPDASTISYEIYNLLGVKVKAGVSSYPTGGSKTLQIDNTTFSSGMYLLKLIATDKNGRSNFQTINITKQ